MNLLRCLILALLTALGAPWALAQEGAEAEGAEEEGAEEEEADAEELPPPSGEQVTVGMFVNNIQVVDLKTHSYELDLYIWFRWTHEALDPASSMDVMNPHEQWGHMPTPTYEEPELLDDGTFYQVVRFQGLLSRKMPLYNYPFDRQELVFVIEDSQFEAQMVRYSADAEGPSLNPELTLPGFVIGTPALRITDVAYPTTFGDTRLAEPAVYSRATLAIPIHRPPVPYGLKLFLPVLCVVLTASLMFLLAPAYVDSRVGVGVTALLTIVALQMTYDQEVPDVGYLMLMDKVYICAYLFVVGGLLVVVQTARLVQQGQEAQALVLHRRGLVGLLGLFLLTTGALVAAAVRAG